MAEPSAERSAPEPSDAELITATRAGDTGAYGLFYQRHAHAVRALAQQLARDQAEAEDLVAETFARVLDVLRRGGGPQVGFRTYLLTALRRLKYDRARGEQRQVVTGDLEKYDPGVPFVDPALEGLERSLVARAFLTLPERWQTVLWHTEIEGAKPGDVAPLLGMSANGVAALAYRAREGLRQAYLQMHLQSRPEETCQPVLDKMGAYVRGGLSRRDTATVEAHLDSCRDCTALYAELADVNHGLRTIVAPLILGPATAAYLGKIGAGAAAGAGGIIGWFRNAPRSQQATAGGVAAGIVLAALALMLVSQRDEPRPEPPPGAAPPAAPPAQPPAQPPPAPPQQPPPAPPAPPAPGAVPAAATSPAPAPSPQPPSAPARLSAAVEPVGTLLRGRPGVVLLTVRNLGSTTSDELLATVDLPPGVMLTPDGTTGQNGAYFQPPDDNGWSCQPTDAGARCQRGPLAGRSTTTTHLPVEVASDAPLDVPPRVSLRSGTARTSATGRAGVRADGMPARFATDGHVRSVAVGNALMSCKSKKPGCAEARERRGRHRNNDDWRMKPIDLDSDPSTTSSSSARLTLPDGGRVRWAGLYWSGVMGPEETRSAKPGKHHPGIPGPLPSALPSAAPSPGSPSPSDPGLPISVLPDPTERPTAQPHAPDPLGLAEPLGSRDTSRSRNASASRGASGSPEPLLPLVPRSPSPTTSHSDPPAAPATPAGPSRTPVSPSTTPSPGTSGTGMPTPTPPVPTTSEKPEKPEPNEPGVLRVRAPGAGSYTEVRTNRVETAKLPSATAYQAFADVTELVRAGGGGEWWAADAATKPGWARYAGWSLVVVVEDPKVPWQEAVVLEGSTVVSRDNPKATLPLHGLRAPGRTASLLMVAWEGDADLTGDRVALDGTPMNPEGGDGNADNALDSSALGAVGPSLTFGVDVDRFTATVPRRPTMTLTSAGDAYLLGALAITAPLPS